MKVVIPSYRRSDNVKTLASIPRCLKDDTFLFVRKEEVDAYARNYSHQCEIISLPDVDGIAETRAAICDTMKDERIFMADDDLRFFSCGIREAGTLKAWAPLEEEQFLEMLMFMEHLCKVEKLYHGHLVECIFPVMKDAFPYTINKWGFTNVYLDIPAIGLENIHYTKKAEFVEDMYAFLGMIKAGFDHAAITRFLIKSSPPNAAGGCSVGRDRSKVNAALQFIYDTYPGMVRWKTGGKQYDSNIPGEEPVKTLVCTAKQWAKKNRSSGSDLLSFL